MKYIAILIIFIVFGCGNTKEKDQKKSEKNTIMNDSIAKLLIQSNILKTISNKFYLNIDSLLPNVIKIGYVRASRNIIKNAFLDSLFQEDTEYLIRDIRDNTMNNNIKIVTIKAHSKKYEGKCFLSCIKNEVKSILIIPNIVQLDKKNIFSLDSYMQRDIIFEEYHTFTKTQGKPIFFSKTPHLQVIWSIDSKGNFYVLHHKSFHQ
jgi:hypothetical protein